MELNLPPALAGLCLELVILVENVNGLPAKLFPRRLGLKQYGMMTISSRMMTLLVSSLRFLAI